MPVRSSQHQVVKLSPGRHTGPEDGACIMELASMLGGERFSDSPRSVCRVIAAFLRCYNDGVDDYRRADLYRFASTAVGTRGSRTLARRRLELCERWLQRARPDIAARQSLRRPTFADRNMLLVHRTAEAAASDPRLHTAALALVDELVATEKRSAAPSDASSLTPVRSASPRRAIGPAR